jgi:hypothetical protein
MSVILVVFCVDVVACSPYSGCCCTATTRLGRAHNNINTKHNKYNRHGTTNQIILFLVTEVKKKYLPDGGQRLTETCWRILRLLKQYDHFNVLF